MLDLVLGVGGGVAFGGEVVDRREGGLERLEGGVPLRDLGGEEGVQLFAVQQQGVAGADGGGVQCGVIVYLRGRGGEGGGGGGGGFGMRPWEGGRGVGTWTWEGGCA